MPVTDEYHVLTKDGDALAEVDQAVRSLGSAEKAGLHRHFFVTRANQTVVMAHAPDAPIATLLRERPGWKEPGV